MTISAHQALSAGLRGTGPQPGLPALLVAGATGTLGNEVLRRMAGTQRYGPIHVLAREQVLPTFRGVHLVTVEGPPAGWPRAVAQVGVILFDPPRMYHERERALWTPSPKDLPATAGWMRECGVTALAIVMPHDQGRLPAALRAGLATLDEQAVVALGFEQVVIVRSAQSGGSGGASRGRLHKLAAWMLGSLAYLVPQSQRPVRAVKIARFVDEALLALRAQHGRASGGVWVASPEWLARAAQSDDVAAVVRDWIDDAAKSRA